MFKKKGKNSNNRNNRRRPGEEESEDDEEKDQEIKVDVSGLEGDEKETIEKTKSKSNKKSKNKDKDKKKSQTFTFGDDNHEEEEEVFNFKVKKSKESRKMKHRLKQQNEQEQEQEKPKSYYHSSSKGEYTTEKLAVLKDQCVVINEKNEENNAKNHVEKQDNEHVTKKPNQNRTTIPDANAIHLARKKRELARQQDDYVPLEDHDPEGNRRDNIDDNQILHFGDTSNYHKDKKQKEIEAAFEDVNSNRMSADAIDNAASQNSDEESSSEDEMSRWEREQIRKGGATVNTNTKGKQQEQQQDQQHGSRGPNRRIIIPRLPEKPLANIDDFILKLDKGIKSITEKFEENEEHLKGLERNIEDIDNREKEFKIKQENFIVNVEFFQNNQNYVKTLIACLDAKVPIINELEAQFHSKLKHTADERWECQKRFFYDDLLELNDILHQPDILAIVPESEVTVDDLGRKRDENGKTRRIQRKKDRKSYVVAGQKDEDDELFSFCSPGIEEKEKEIAKNDQSRVFVDSQPQFGTLEGIVSFFGNWKTKDIESYGNAYISLSLPKILSPFLRLELLTWNPTEVDCIELESMHWFELIASYGDPITGEDDVDLLLLPTMIEKVIFPKLIGLISYVWNVASFEETRRLNLFILHLRDQYDVIGKEKKSSEALISSIAEKLRTFVNTFYYIPKISLEEELPNQLMLRAFKTFNSCMLWNGIISKFVLQDILVESIINDHFLPFLKTTDEQTALDYSERIIFKLPSEWLTEICCLPLLDAVRKLAKKSKNKDNKLRFIGLLEKFNDSEEIMKIKEFN